MSAAAALACLTLGCAGSHLIVDAAPVDELDDDTSASAGDTAEDTADTDTDTADTGNTPARPCAALDGWQTPIKLPAEQLYSYESTGCGVLAAAPDCADSTVASLTAANWDLNAGPVLFFVNGWFYGETTCTAIVVDYDFPDVQVVYTALVTVQ